RRRSRQSCIVFLPPSKAASIGATSAPALGWRIYRARSPQRRRSTAAPWPTRPSSSSSRSTVHAPEMSRSPTVRPEGSIWAEGLPQIFFHPCSKAVSSELFSRRAGSGHSSAASQCASYSTADTALIGASLYAQDKAALHLLAA